MKVEYCYYCSNEKPLRSLKVDADPLVFHCEDENDDDYEQPDSRWRYICADCIPMRREEGCSWIYGPQKWRAYNGPTSYHSIYGG